MRLSKEAGPTSTRVGLPRYLGHSARDSRTLLAASRRAPAAPDGILPIKRRASVDHEADDSSTPASNR